MSDKYVENKIITEKERIIDKINDINFFECEFKNINFFEEDFSYSKFENCKFENCNLSLIKLNEVSLQNVNFIKTRIRGVDFTKCNNFLLDMNMKDCDIEYSNFSELNLKEINFTGSQIIECVFIDSDLRKANFQKSVLTKTLFDGCDLRKANFQDSQGYDINIKKNRVDNARFSSPEALNLLNSFKIIIDK